MDKAVLIQTMIEYLQAEYIKTGRNDPVEWLPLASKFGATEDEMNAAINTVLHSDGGQVDLRPAGRSFIVLGPRGLAGAKK